MHAAQAGGGVPWRHTAEAGCLRRKRAARRGRGPEVTRRSIAGCFQPVSEAVMTRSFLGLTLAAVALSLPAFASAQSAPRAKAAQTGTAPIMSSQSGQLRARAKPSSNMLHLQLTEGNDSLRFTGDLAVHVTVQRGARRYTLAVRSATESDQAAVLALLANSLALRSFDTVMDSPWGRSARPAAPFR